MDGNLVPGDIFNDESLIIYNEQRTYFTNGNKKIDIEYTQTDISDENGDVIGIVHFIHDIRKQVEYEIGLENARVEAENSNRAKNDFLANVTHELRTPLNTIMGMNSLISELSQDEEISTMHQLISSAAENLLSQLIDILELSEIERGNITVNASRFSINKVIQEILKSFETQLELKSLSAFVKTEGALPFIVGDKNKIRDIIACLISNAVKFTKKGSITILSSIDVDKLNISIKDTGIGLSEEQKKLIFNDFTQVDGSHTRIYGGNGVGLALVRKLLKLLEGSIVVESDNVTGSEFSITIPIEISEDQKSSLKKIEENVDKKDFFPMDIKSKTYKDLMRLLNEISDLLNNESFDQIDKKIKTYCNIYTISDLNYESQILFRLSVALKLKKKNKIQEIINEFLNESINSTGGIYENSYS
jgi:signal transduction histidine kinase